MPGCLLGGGPEGSSEPPVQQGPALVRGLPVWAEGLCALLGLLVGAKSLLQMKALDVGAVKKTSRYPSRGKCKLRRSLDLVTKSLVVL